MKFLLVGVIIIGNILYSIEASEKIPNNLILEKITYQVFNKTLLKDASIKWKTVAYNMMTYHAEMNVTSPITEFWVNLKLYYKYRRYEKYLVNMWVEYCNAVKDPEKNPVSKFTYDNYLKSRDKVNMNFDIKCPFYGKLLAETREPMNMSQLVFPLMQAGRYRLDFRFAPKQDGPIYSIIQVYGSISDLRVWF